jgi:hypothetical protein
LVRTLPDQRVIAIERRKLHIVDVAALKALAGLKT